ncbi:MAG: DHH family phosphoesterase, partial [Muribaculaceae bacterium]|nr:DHH family phosphoesterase [Muribaculaceae bacterium]
MLTRNTHEDFQRLTTLLRGSRRVVIACHLSPDGDALGSSLGLREILMRINPAADVRVITPDEPTKTLSFLPGFDRLMPYTRYKSVVESTMKRADLFIALDFNAPSRTDLLAPVIEKGRCTKVLIDHHLDPEDFVDISFSYPESSSTCYLLFRILEKCGLGRFMTPQAADCFLTGMMTDTGNFSYNIADPEIFPTIGRLIQYGADKARLDKLLFRTATESSLRIQGYALSDKMEVFRETNAALITLTREELNRFGYVRGDTEGLVNVPLEIPGILYSAFLREEESYIKVSMRSVGDFPVSALCADYFGGGGHLNAAGGEFKGSMEECVERFKSLLDRNKKEYIDPSPVLA